MTIAEAVKQMLEVQKRKNGNAINVDGSSYAVGVARVGSSTQQIVAATMAELQTIDFGAPLHSLVIAGDIHACEKEHVQLYELS